MNISPAPIFAQLGSYGLAYHSIKAWNRILQDEYLPSDVIDKIEDIILALEYIEGWEPCDDDIVESNSVGTPWHDGCK